MIMNNRKQKNDNIVIFFNFYSDILNLFLILGCSVEDDFIYYIHNLFF